MNIASLQLLQCYYIYNNDEILSYPHSKVYTHLMLVNLVTRYAINSIGCSNNYSLKMRVTTILILSEFSGAFTVVYFPTILGLAASLNVKYIISVNSGSALAGLIAQIVKILQNQQQHLTLKILIMFLPFLYHNLILCYTIIFIIGSYIGYFLLTKICTIKQIDFDAKERKKFPIPYYQQQISQKLGKYIYCCCKKFMDAWIIIIFNLFCYINFIPSSYYLNPMLLYVQNKRIRKIWQLVVDSYVFMVGDWIGRQIPSWNWFIDIWNLKSLLVASILRLLFIGLFIIQIVPYYHCPECSSSPALKDETPDSILLVHNDLFAQIIIMLFAVSNGWFMCAILCKYKTIMKPITNRSHAVNFMTLCLNI
ncbi:Nucleoside transporter [Spironucleus salmonicida]|uniref:Nucleoside transporter n=1 Tax=Spironucleus salmonicida TaxID=348837 RepID=V6LLI0_9EUKA|nr:Nucleoside transporter [Spironucleus salmonicida]|eukprot:EST45520.1 Nucleoside transporter [Spironucleus salmonicida]